MFCKTRNGDVNSSHLVEGKEQKKKHLLWFGRLPLLSFVAENCLLSAAFVSLTFG